MDLALVAFDFTKAGAILADMVVSYLAAGAPPSNQEGPHEHDVQNCRSTPVAAGMHYIRQSTLAQVRINQESTERQYNLMNKAKALG